MSDKKELTELEKAQQLLQEDKNKRLQSFSAELEELCKKYNCSIHQGQIMIKAD